MADFMELDDGIKFAKRGEIAFGFALGKKPEEHKIIFSKKRKPQDIGKKLKREVGSKIAYGTASVNQGALTLKPEFDKVPGLKRVMKEYLSANKSNVKKVEMEEEEEAQT